jgi:hypothetical protein
MTDTVNDFQATDLAMRKSALVAGVGILLIALLAGLVTLGAIEGLVTEGNATRTAQDILASEGLFRFGIGALVLVVILDVIVAWALFEFFKVVHAGVSMLAGWLRLAFAAVFAVAISQLVGALDLLSNAGYLKTFSTGQLQTQALLEINAFDDIWQVGLSIFGLHLSLLGYLVYKSGFAPKWLGVLLVIAGLGYLVDSFGVLLVASYSVDVKNFTFLGELLLGLWLLVKGGRHHRTGRPGTPDLA